MVRNKKNLKKRTIVLIAFSFAILSFLSLVIFHNFQEKNNFENLFFNFNKRTKYTSVGISSNIFLI